MRHGAMALLLLVMSGCVLEEASDKGVEYVGPPSNWALGTFHLSAPEAPGWAVNLTIRADGRFYVSSYHCRDLVETLGQADRPVTSYGRADALSNGHVGLQDDDYHD
ncbi:MAG: hypothetical protein KC609_00680, partial [Myxococcales bacterium]|nr:hypothetical protein [Myxococcales bacterium]